MNLDKLISSIQSVFGIAKGELMISLSLIIGVAIGSFVDYDRTNLNGLDGIEMSSNASSATTLNFGSKVEEYETETETETVKNSNSDIALLNQKANGKEPQTYNSKKNDSGIVGKININTASKLELKKLKGIGEKTAQKIIKYRKKTPFKVIEDIKKVKGIGPKKFESMKKHITV
jgi:comEA protein